MSHKLLHSLNRISSKLKNMGLEKEYEYINNLYSDITIASNYKTLIKIAQSETPVSQSEMQSVAKLAEEKGMTSTLQKMFGPISRSVKQWASKLAMLFGVCLLSTGCSIIGNLPPEQRVQYEDVPGYQWDVSKGIGVKIDEESNIFYEEWNKPNQEIIPDMSEYIMQYPPIILENNKLYRFDLGLDLNNNGRYYGRYKLVPPYVTNMEVPNEDLVKRMYEQMGFDSSALLSRAFQTSSSSELIINHNDQRQFRKNIQIVKFISRTADSAIRLLHSDDNNPSEI